MQTTKIIILAGGKGTRMQSEIPKVLHKVKGTSMLQRIIQAVKPIDSSPTIVVKHKAEMIIESINDNVVFAEQGPKPGTGAAVLAGLESLEKNVRSIVVICGDKPFVKTTSLQNLIATHQSSGATVTMGYIDITHADNQISNHFTSMGRVLCNADNTVTQIIENSDATNQQKNIPYRNASFYCFDGPWIRSHIMGLHAHNKQNELYITDLIAAASREKSTSVLGIEISAHEGFGINTKEDLAYAQSIS